MPVAARNDDLRCLAVENVGAETVMGRRAAIGGEAELEGRAGIVMPDLDRIDPVPVGSVAGGQQIVDRGRMAAPVGRLVVAEGLAIPAALRVGRKVEPFGDVACGQRGEAPLKLSLRRRISAKTAAGGALSMPSSLRMAESPVRK